MHGVRWLAWVGILWAFWFLLVGEWNRIEIVAASCVAPVAAAVVELAVSHAGLRARVPLRWVARAKTVPLTIVVDFGVVTWALLRAVLRRERVHGTFRVKPFPATGTSPEGVGVRAWTTIAATFSPNAYVIDIDPEHDVVLLHDLVPLSSSEKPA